MCYLPPGPRCSDHAHKELLHALKAVEVEKDVNKKIILHLKADEARKNFYTTPRGQNELKREIGALSGTKDEEERIKLWELKRNLLEGEDTRKKQLEAYNKTIDTRKTFVKDSLGTKNKNDIATAVVFNTILENAVDSNIDVHILKPNFIGLTANGRTAQILCLPEKFQTIWDSFRSENNELFSDNPLSDVNMNDFMGIFNTSLVYSKLSTEQVETIRSWVTAKLTHLEVDLIAAVDRRTEQVSFFTPTELLDYYSINFKLSKRLGGTTQYRQGAEFLKAQLDGTVFSEAEIKEVRNDKGVLLKTILLNAAPQPEHLRSVDGIYLSWKPNAESEQGGYYEVRSKHTSTRYNLKVVLSKQVFTQTVSSLDALKPFLLSENTAVA